jgi:hypothetical protein
MRMNTKNLLGVLLLAVVCCTTVYAEKKAEPFTPAPVASDETNVYVIRESAFMGGARGVWIAANDKVVADMPNGSHVLLKLKAGLNNVHGVQGLAGFAFAQVDNRPGETVYLHLIYAQGKMEEVTADVAGPMITKTKAVEPLADDRPNTAYDDVTINPSMLGFPIMKTADTSLEPDENSAVITFIRPGNLIKDVPFDVWDESGYVGSIKGGYYFDIRVTPGRHVYIGKSEHYAVLNADVAAGKHYYVEYEVDMGWNQAHVKIVPLDLTKDAAKIKGIKKLTATTIDAEVLDSASVKPRIERGNEYLKDARQKIADGKLPSREMLPNQGQ